MSNKPLQAGKKQYNAPTLELMLTASTDFIVCSIGGTGDSSSEPTIKDIWDW